MRRPPRHSQGHVPTQLSCASHQKCQLTGSIAAAPDRGVSCHRVLSACLPALLWLLCFHRHPSLVCWNVIHRAGWQNQFTQSMLSWFLQHNTLVPSQLLSARLGFWRRSFSVLTDTRAHTQSHKTLYENISAQRFSYWYGFTNLKSLSW